MRARVAKIKNGDMLKIKEILSDDISPFIISNSTST